MEIDLIDAYVWDLTGVAAEHKVALGCSRQGAEVVIAGMTEAKRAVVRQVRRHDKTHLPVRARAH